MKIYSLSNIIRIIFNSIATLFTIFVILGLILDYLINDGNSFLLYLILFISAFCVKILVECFILLLNKYSKKSIAFFNNYIVYKRQKYYISILSFKYFKFQWTFLETDLVIPKLVICIENEKNIICYITKKQLAKLKSELKYNIKEI